ncbi:MAG: translation factor Sua5, partial [Pseudomonadota bacterium]|nr:translation factor Sua5 [Pseudomonadota bacterium]
HYAPRTPVALVAAAKFDECLQRLAVAGRRMVVMAIGAAGAEPLQFVSAGALWQMPDDPTGYAHDLYAALRALDSAGADVILIEAPPHSEPWQAIHDRLQRAAHDSAGILERLL